MSRAVNLTLSQFSRRLAKELMKARGYRSRTGLVEELLRKEHERVFGLPGQPVARKATK